MTSGLRRYFFSHCSRTWVKNLLFRQVTFQPPFRLSEMNHLQDKAKPVIVQSSVHIHSRVQLEQNSHPSRRISVMRVNPTCVAQSTYIYRVPQCMSLVRIGSLPPPLSPASVPLPPGTEGGGGGAHQGTTNLTFFQKMKNKDPLMGAKLKSKTHLLNMFFFIC